jgi:hypothetical protein
MDKGVVSRNIRVALGSNIYRIPILNWDHSMHSFSFHKIKLIIMLSYHDLDSTYKTEIISMQTCHMHIQSPNYELPYNELYICPQKLN